MTAEGSRYLKYKGMELLLIRNLVVGYSVKQCIFSIFNFSYFSNIIDLKYYLSFDFQGNKLYIPYYIINVIVINVVVNKMATRSNVHIQVLHEWNSF